MLSEKEFIQAIQENQQIILKVCHMYMDSSSDREDLFQEIVFNAWRGVSNFKGHSKFSTWLYKVALNTAITFFKKDKQRNKIDASQVSDVQSPDIQDTIDEQLAAMGKAIEDLSKIDKALVMLYLDDFNYQEIAAIMGISVNNVGVKMNRIKMKLRDNAKKHL